MTDVEKARIKKAIDTLVSDLACCDRDGCRCWQSGEYLNAIREYAEEEQKRTPYEVPELLGQN